MNDWLISWMNGTARACGRTGSASFLAGQGHGPVMPVQYRHSGSAAYSIAVAAAAAGDIFPLSLPSLPRLSDVTRCVATPLVTSLRLVDQSATTGQFIFLLRHAEPWGYFYRLVYAGGLRAADRSIGGLRSATLWRSMDEAIGFLNL